MELIIDTIEGRDLKYLKILELSKDAPFNFTCCVPAHVSDKVTKIMSVKYTWT